MSDGTLLTTDLSSLESPSLNNGQIFVGDVSNNTQAVDMTGDVNINNTGVTTIQPDSVTYPKMQNVVTASVLGNDTDGGEIEELPVIEQYIPLGANQTLLENTSNWTSKVFTATILGTFQGQKHYDSDYIFQAVDDNIWVRYSRV